MATLFLDAVTSDATLEAVDDDNVYTPDFKFPADKSVLIRLIPYNPYFPTIEKEMKHGSLVMVGRFQRNGNVEDPTNEGIYFRSTVVSRKHAQLMFIDGEVMTRQLTCLNIVLLERFQISRWNLHQLQSAVIGG